MNSFSTVVPEEQWTFSWFYICSSNATLKKYFVCFLLMQNYAQKAAFNLRWIMNFKQIFNISSYFVVKFNACTINQNYFFGTTDSLYEETELSGNIKEQNSTKWHSSTSSDNCIFLSNRHVIAGFKNELHRSLFYMVLTDGKLFSNVEGHKTCRTLKNLTNHFTLLIVSIGVDWGFFWLTFFLEAWQVFLTSVVCCCGVNPIWWGR